MTETLFRCDGPPDAARQPPFAQCYVENAGISAGVKAFPALTASDRLTIQLLGPKISCYSPFLIAEKREDDQFH
jgi:hypothetical protein